MALTTVPSSLSATALTLTTAAQPNITSVGTLTGLTVSGNIATGGITINGAGSTISDSSDLGIVSGGDLTLDVTGDIILDADGGDIKFKDGGTHIGTLGNSSNDLFLFPLVSDADFKIFGNDGGSTITALTLDMSNAGKATFNAGGAFNGDVSVFGANRKVHVGESGSGGTFGFIGWNDASNYLYLGNSYNSAYNTDIVIDSGGNVGVGITSPSSYATDSNSLAVLGQIRVQGVTNTAGVPILALRDNNSGFFVPATNEIAVSCGAAKRMHINSNGHVGIGTTPTSWSSGYISMQIGDRGFVGAHSGSDLYLGQNAYFDSGWKYEASVAASLTQHSGGEITHKVVAAGTAGNAISWIDALHITTTGRVGIGTTSPSANLTITDENAGQATIQARNFSTSATGGFGNAHAFEFRAATSTTTHGMLVALNENNIGRRSLEVADSTGIFATFVQGKLGIGRNNPSARLHIQSTGSTTYSGSSAGSNIGLYLTNSESGAAGRTIGIGLTCESNAEVYLNAVTAANNNGGDFVIASRNGGTRAEKMRVHAAGSVTKPLNPSFQARYPAVTAGGNATIVFSGTIHNIGSHYNTSTGVFTAPVAGSYLFSFVILMDPSGTNHYARVLFAKNGTSGNVNYGDSLESADYDVQQDYQSLGMTAVIYMNANDTMRLQNTGQSPTYGTSYGSFSGCLLG